MEKNIIELNEKGKIKDLCSLLNEIDHKQLFSLIDNRTVRGKGDPVTLIRAILSGSPVDRNEGVKRRLEIYKHCISVLQNHDIHNKVASELVGLLLLETDNFPPKCLAVLAGVYVDIIKNGITNNAKCLELFPKVLSALDAAETVEYKDNTMTGSQYKSHTLNTLCSGRWDASTVTHLAAMFKDIPMINEELKFVLTKITRMFKDMEMQELPPLVYQLLLLCSKGHKRLVLEGMSKFFAMQDAQYKQDQQSNMSNSEIELSESTTLCDQLRHVEGTVLLHISFAVKQDQELGRDFIKYLKTGQTTEMLTPFNLALALTVARIHRFQDQVFDFLKSSILKSYKDNQRRQDSHWIREIAPETVDVATNILDSVLHSTYGWDQVTQGLVQLGFVLMDAFGPKGAFGKPVDSYPTTHLTPTQKACALGSKLLLDTFKAHKMVRGEILEQILNRVVTKAIVSAPHYLDLLACVVKTAPQILLDSLPKVREAFDYLSFLPIHTAEGLLRAIQPLLKISMTLKDSLILVLRKAMFSRQVESRRIAVSGFLLILKNFKVLGGMPSSQSSESFSISASQVHVDVHMTYNPHSNEALCLEILGNLRRCLTQQADVRTTLYQGLYDVLCKNTQLANPILSILFAQWKKYYEASDDVQPPLKLEPCVVSQGEQTLATEPLAHLLSTIVQCLFQVCRIEEQQRPTDDELHDEPPEQIGLKNDVEAMMESLQRRMINCDLEDFELDKSADFSMANSVGVKNNIYALLVSGIYEVLIEYTFTTGDYALKSSEDVLKLFQNHQKLTDLFKDKSSSKAKSSTPKSLLSFRFITLMLKALFSDSTPAHQESLNVLRENLDLTKYLVTVSQQKLQMTLDKGFCDDPEGHNQEKLFKYCSSLGRVLLKHYHEDLQTSDENKRDKGKNIAQLCLDTFTLTVNITCDRFTDRIHTFLSSIDPNRDSTTGEGNNEQEQQHIHTQITRFQRMVITVLGGTEEDRSIKEAVSLLHVIGKLTKCLKPNSEQFDNVQSWFFRICTEQNIDETSTVKTVLQLLYQITAQQKSCTQLLVAMARDVHSQLGDVDNNITLQDKTNFSVVNQKSASSVLLIIISLVERELEDIEWTVNRMKTEIQAQDPEDSVGPTQREDWDKSVTTKLGNVINCVHDIVQTAVPLTCVDHVLKIFTQVYGTLVMISKLYLSLYQQKQGTLSTRFEKLVKHSSTKLTQFVYAMITYIQAAQNESLQQAHDKANKKGKEKRKAEPVKSQVLKETKSIPGLIFAIEHYEGTLIKLSQKSKINLMDHFKMSTSRDFRIQGEVLQRAFASDNEEDSSDSDQEQNEADQENKEPAEKKAKITVKFDAKKGKNTKNKKLSVAY